jgi:3-oxoacyl-[acyl-carrier protein] reductase
VLDVNLTGVFLMTQSAARVMMEKGGGVIINLITGSTRDERNEAAFVASMSGLEGFTRQAARELSPHAIRVYAVENTGDTIIEKVFELFEE